VCPLGSGDEFDKVIGEVTVPRVAAKGPGRPEAVRPTYLIVLSSTSQLYSGIGTTLFDWIRYAQHAFEFTMLIDVGDARNFEIARRFCRRHRIRLLPSPPLQQVGCPDFGVADVGLVLQSGNWDYIECISWANAATNLAVLAHKPDASTLLFTPHTQPLSTLRSSEQLPSVMPVFEEMLRRSDAIFIDSRDELKPYERTVGSSDREHHIYLGVNDEVFGYAPVEPRNQILCLGDFAEQRKRTDLMLDAFARCLKDEPGLTLALVGNRSLEVDLPVAVAGSVRRHGYVEQPTLVRLYRESRILLHLSDFEAFGLPIAEALCCGTPVVITDREPVRSIFGDLPGVHLVGHDMLAGVASALRRAPTDPAGRRSIAERAHERFAPASTYGRKLQVVKALRA
jgi:glycosyltransferase involved in cell wall biosynthesis